MNAVFSIGKVKVGTEAGEEEKDVELVTLSGGFLVKDEITRVATDDDRFVFKEEYAAFKTPPAPVKAAAAGSVDADFTVLPPAGALPPPSPVASAGASPAAAAPGADAAGALPTAQPLGG